MPKTKYNPHDICNKEEFEQFVSIHKRFKQIIKGAKEFQGDFNYFKTELDTDIKEFWPVVGQILKKLVEHSVEIQWHTNLESSVDTNFYRP